MRSPTTLSDLARLLQGFFCHYLIQQRQASPQTLRGYRDTFRLLLRFCEHYRGQPISELVLADLDAPLILAFLEDLETQRHNKVRSRNTRLAAIRSFLHYVALQEPSALPRIQSVLAIPMKRYDRPLVGCVSREEMEAILQAPDNQTWSGQRDRALLMTLYNTGARVSEIIAVRRIDLEIGQGQALHLHGKGRKERVVPLWKRTTRLLNAWSSRIGPEPQQPLFPNRFGQPLTRSGVTARLKQAVTTAAERFPSLKDKPISPHWVRHSTALHLLQAGVDITVIALWLGHERIETTHQYLEADLKMKERALATLQPPNITTSRYRPSNTLLAFLDSL